MLSAKETGASRWRLSLSVVATMAALTALSVSAVQAAPALPSASAASAPPPAPSNAPPVSLPPDGHLPPVPAQTAVPAGAAQIAESNKAFAGDTPDPFAGPKPTTGILGPVLNPILGPVLGPILGPVLGAAPQPTTELTGRRNATSKTFASTTPGKVISQAYSGPIQFRGADGVMHDTDPTLIPSAPGRFAVKAAAVGVDLASSPTDANLAVVSFDAGHSVGFGLSGAAPGPAATPTAAASLTPQVLGGSTATTIVHPAILPNVNLELASGSGGLKETIVLTAPSAPASFSFPLHLNGVTAAVDAATGDVVYRDAAGVVLGRTPHGFMVDSKIDPKSGDPARSDAVTYTLAGFGPSQTLTVTLDQAWLADPARQYPVSVDPTVTPANTSADDTYIQQPYNNDESGDYQLKVGTFDSGADKARSFMHFDNLGYLNGQQVSGATLWLYDWWSYSCTASPANIYSVNQAWTGSGLRTYPGASLGALAGSSNFADSTSCGNAGWVGFDITGTVANWAATNGASNLGLAVVAPDEGNNSQWKKFYSWNQGNGGVGQPTPHIDITWSAAATAPSSPTNAFAAPANASANISWNLSASDGGSPIDSYWVNAFDGVTGAYVGLQSEVCATCTSTSIGGLTNGHPYYFGVYAHNAVNFSAPDYTGTITPTVLPGAPQSAVASAGNGVDSMVWSPPVPNGGSAVTGYAVLAYYTNGTYSGHDIVVCATCYSATVTGLTNGVAYNLYVTAGNPAGWGALSLSGPTTPNVNVAGAPVGQAAYVPGTAAIGVQWNPPASLGNAALASYAINTYDLATGFVGTTVISCPCGALMFTAVTGLVTGHTYFFAIYAYNSYGYGPVAATATSAPNPAAPGPPTNAIATPGDTTLAVSWVPPAAIGTTTIDSYLFGAVDQATGAVVGLTINCPCTNPVTATDPGLTNGHSYQVAVYAHNTAGYGPPVASNIATPMGGPPPTTTTTTVPVTTTTSTTVPGTTTTTTTVPVTTTTSTTVPGTTTTSTTVPVTTTTSTTVPGTTTTSTTVPVTTTTSTTVPGTTTTTVPSGGQTYPGASTSRYVNSTDTSASLDALGCTEAQNQAPGKGGPQNGLSALDFGAQVSGPGTLPPFGRGSLTDQQVHDLSLAYAGGLTRCGGKNYIISVATNNSGSLQVSDPTGTGTDWGKLVAQISTDLPANSTAAGISIQGGSDIEPGTGFNPPGVSATWAQAYADSSAGHVYYNQGSADGCTLPTGNENPQCTTTWKEGDVWKTAGGIYNSGGTQISIPLPEIYVSGQSSHWINVATWGVRNDNGRHANFAGAFAYQGITPADKSPQDAWQTLFTDLNATSNDPGVIQKTLAYATNDFKD